MFSSRLDIKSVKKSTNQETGMGNRGCQKVLNDTKLALNEHEWPPYYLGSIWYHSEPSDPIPQASFLVETFLLQDSSNNNFKAIKY